MPSLAQAAAQMSRPHTATYIYQSKKGTSLSLSSTATSLTDINLPTWPYRALQIPIPTARDQETCSRAPWGSCIAAMWQCAPYSGFSQDVSCKATAACLLNGSDLLIKLLNGLCTKQGRQVSTLGIVTHAACFCRQGEECHCP